MVYGKTEIGEMVATELTPGRCSIRHMGHSPSTINRPIRGAINRVISVCVAFLVALSVPLIMIVTLAVTMTDTATGARAQPGAGDRPLKIVAFGDSLTAGYLLAPNESFPAVLGRVLTARGVNAIVINAGVSGDTTAAARERIDWAVPPDADAVILEFGANDGLRGLDPAAARSNLEAIITRLKSQKIDILLAGMVAPRSMGDPYTQAFDAIFPALATQHDLLLYPLFIEKIALRPELNLSDGLHPNAKGVEAIVADILPKVDALIARVQARRAALPKG